MTVGMEMNYVCTLEGTEGQGSLSHQCMYPVQCSEEGVTPWPEFGSVYTKNSEPHTTQGPLWKRAEQF